MILLIDIADNEAASLMEMIKSHSSATARAISAPDAALFAEIKEIKKAFKNAERIKAGKLKGRSADDFLSEL